jgi:hypothetical protein
MTCFALSLEETPVVMPAASLPVGYGVQGLRPRPGQCRHSCLDAIAALHVSCM